MISSKGDAVPQSGESIEWIRAFSTKRGHLRDAARRDHGSANAAEAFMAAKRRATSNGPRNTPRYCSAAHYILRERSGTGFLASLVNGTRFRVNKIINKAR